MLSHKDILGIDRNRIDTNITAKIKTYRILPKGFLLIVGGQ